MSDAIQVRQEAGTPMPDEEWQAETIWDKHADAFIETFNRWEEVGTTNHRKIAKAITAETPDSILEVGSGTGILYRALLKEGYSGKYLGIDRTKSFIDYSNNLYGEGLFKQGKAQDMKIPGVYDLCIMQDVLRHNRIADRSTILKNVVPHVRKKLIMTEPLGETDLEKWSEADWPTLDKILHIEYWDGHLNLMNLIDTIHEIKPVKEFSTIPRGGAFETDKQLGMHENFIVVLFEGGKK